jgi:mannonate dehydratase
LDAVPLPRNSSYITRPEHPTIVLGKSPQRDRETDNICQMIRNASQAGIRTLKYNMSILGVVRTESTPGRSGATYSTFNYEKAANRDTPTETGPAISARIIGCDHAGAGGAGGTVTHRWGTVRKV